MRLRAAEEAAELAEVRFEKLTQAVPVKIFATDGEGRITYVNDLWRDHGLPTEGHWLQETMMHCDDLALCRQRWRQAMAEGTACECEIRVSSPGGGPERWNQVRLVPFQRVGGVLAGWIGTFVDLTERKEREAELRVSEKLALTGRLSNVIAHEINNPLETITNLMYLLRTETPSDGVAAGYISLVESELGRISGITKQTLRWNREVSDQRESFRLSEIADDVLRLFAGKMRNRQLTPHIEGDRSLELKGVSGQIRQVLTNLVSNAIDASPMGGSVCITLLGNAAEVGFAVKDQGHGIDEATLARLFEPFHSTKGELGNGLGLHISKEIVERHGGRVVVESRAGLGTTMTVWLPR